MEVREVTITVRREGRRRKKRRTSWMIYSRLSLLMLAAMVTARLLLLMIDVIQLKAGIVGAVSIPASAVVLVLTGWKLHEWVEQGKERDRCTTTSATIADAPLTRANGATAKMQHPNL